jgi:aromatic-L-amino-acid/L-tryptophan decarboxylase
MTSGSDPQARLADEANARLEPDRATQERWLELFARFALDHIGALPNASALGKVGAEGLRIADSVSLPVPDGPLEPERVIEVLARGVEAALVTAGPGYLAYIPGGGLYAAALADLVSNCLNRYTGLAAAAPAFCRLEADVLAWLGREFGYGSEARGLFTSGGSLANWSAIVTARHARFGDSGELHRAVAYTSSQVHHSVGRSMRLAGIPSANLRVIDADRHFRLPPDALAEAVRADRAAGQRPFLVIASAGTTNTGAVDPLPRLADLCAAERVWLHVDGAYGGAFMLCPEGRARLAGIERADSITFDPHKGLFLPYGTGCLLVREGERLREAHQEDADYLQDFDELDRAGEPPSPTDYGPELSRDFRGLRVWLPLMLHGADAFRAALAEKLVLTRRFHDGLRALVRDGRPIEIVAEPELSVVPFRLARRTAEPLDAWNRRNIAFLAAINARARVYLSSTRLPVADGAAFTLRVCVVSFRTHAERIDAALEDVAEACRAAEATTSAPA